MRQVHIDVATQISIKEGKYLVPLRGIIAHKIIDHHQKRAKIKEENRWSTAYRVQKT